MWKNIYFKKTNVEHETDNGFLIKMPSSSEFKGYKFWHPSKLVREKGNFLYFSYTSDFCFKLFKGKEVLKANASDIETAFNSISNEITDMFKGKEESYLIVQKPEKIYITRRVNECLKNN